MKVDFKKLPKSIVELTIEEETKKIAKFRKQVIDYLGKNTDIKGFRKGVNIPEDVIVRKVGEEQINSMTIDRAIDKFYQDAIKKFDLLPVGKAEIKEIVSQSPLKVIINVEVFPEIKISDDYKNIKLKKTQVKVTKKEVEKAMDEIQTKFTRFEESIDKGYKAKMGDKITIDTVGYDENNDILDGTTMKSYPLILGANVLVPGFEDGLVGAKLGDELNLDIEFPKDYHLETFAGKKTKFNVVVHKIDESIKPEFTEEFIEQLRGKKLDLAGFEKLIKEEIRETKSGNARLEDENKLLDELEKVSELDPGESMINNQVKKVYEEMKENITKGGAKVADYLDSLKVTEEEYLDKTVRPIAERRLYAELILHKLQEIVKIEVTDEELEKEISVIMEKFESDKVKERLKGLYKKDSPHYNELKSRLGYSKLIDTFFE